MGSLMFASQFFFFAEACESKILVRRLRIKDEFEAQEERGTRRGAGGEGRMSAHIRVWCPSYEDIHIMCMGVWLYIFWQDTARHCMTL
mmetsp:Transcript_64114/g.93863  ORF Transcript_64114/g.93863 Transcript_64114/m.93863 type:complete len:88 (-) Transcript_64114:89-352(-)